jgi:predicted  nucleic acid-binding Zn-ribbon protein
MTNPGAILRELHRLRRFAKDLQTKIEQAPRTLKAQQARVTRQEENLKGEQDAVKQLKVTMHDKEVTLKTTLGQITKYEKQQNEAAGKKEYDALQHEIDAAKKKVSQLEDEILDALGRLEEQTAKLPEHEKALKQVREEVAQFERESDSRLAGFAEQLKQAQQELATVEEGLKPESRSTYNRLVSARGEDAMSAVVERTCSACYTAITAQSYNELMQGNFVICKSCGRILYLPAE